MLLILGKVGKLHVVAAAVVIAVAGGILISLFGPEGETHPSIDEAQEAVNGQTEEAGGSAGGVSGQVSEEATATTTRVVEMSSSGFSPSVITINAGDTVEFRAVDEGSYWPASAVHPTHTVYPGSGISKCGTDEEGMIFDSCGDVDSYSFTFDEEGEWKYHNHLQPSVTGTVVVE